jgi:hypothetical protein
VTTMMIYQQNFKLLLMTLKLTIPGRKIWQ